MRISIYTIYTSPSANNSTNPLNPLTGTNVFSQREKGGILYKNIENKSQKEKNQFSHKTFSFIQYKDLWGLLW